MGPIIDKTSSFVIVLLALFKFVSKTNSSVFADQTKPRVFVDCLSVKL